jgi:anti-sigma B factor antagonist
VQNHFSVEAHSDGRACFVAISGELDLAAAPSLEEELDRALNSGASVIVLDLASLDFIDSTGLSVIVRAHQQAQESGRELGLVNAAAQVERLLTLTGLAERLGLPDDVRAGLSDSH